MSRRTRSRIPFGAADAQRAIYIDFEGFKDQSPALLGILVEDDFQQIVLDAGLEPAARAKGLAVVDGRTLLRDVVDRAEREKRLICAFSQHELNVACNWFQVDLDPHYFNARPFAKSWWRRAHPDVRPGGPWTQRFFEEGLCLKRPLHLRCGNATNRLRHVMGQCEQHGDYARLTRTAKGKWTKLLKYNELDVRYLAAIVRTVSAPPSSGAAVVKVAAPVG